MTRNWTQLGPGTKMAGEPPARVWYLPALPGYGYDDAIPAVFLRRTARRCVLALLTNTTPPHYRTIATVHWRMRLRDTDAPIDDPTIVEQAVLS